MSDRFNTINARSRRVPSVIFKVLLGWILSALVLALMVPLLNARGVALRGWMVWAILIAALALFIGPNLVRRFTARD